MRSSTLYLLVDTFFWVYMMLLVVRILSSWFVELRDNPVIRFIGTLTDPYLNFFRQFIPPIGMLDISPLVAFFSLQFIEYLVKSILFL